jgi:Ni,Fe-hydrogenase I small subunit
MFRRTATVMFLILAVGTCAVQAKNQNPAKNCHPSKVNLKQ